VVAVGAVALLAGARLEAQNASGVGYACPAREYEKPAYALAADPEDFAGTARLRTRRADFRASRLLGAHEGVELEQTTTRGGRSELRLTFVYTGRDWLFIQSGESLRFLTRGEMVRLTTEGASREEPELVGGQVMRERAVYAIDTSTLRALASAQAGEARVYLYGAKARREYVMNAAVSCTIARFAAAVLRAPAGAPATRRPEPGAVVGGRVATRITITLPGGGQRAAGAEVPLVLIDAAGRRLATAAPVGGVGITVVLPAGRYRAVTPAPLEWAGRRYRWDVGFTVRPGLPAVELTASNARAAAPDDAAPRRRSR
jgi:hypothetical protein